MYEIRVDLENRLICNKMVGYWDAATAERFSREFRIAIQKVAATGPGWKILADHMELDVQPPEVNVIFSEISAFIQANGFAKVAIYMPGALNRLQMKRVAGDPRFQTFASEEEARAWLDE